MAAAKRKNKHEVERDRAEISKLYLQGKTQTEIVEELKKDPLRKYTLTQPIISRDLRAIQAHWIQQTMMNFNEARSRELAKIDQLEREYWRGWERSRQAKKKTQSEQQDVKGKVKQSAKMSSEEMMGDPKYLQGVERCIDRRCQLLGLDAPKRVQIRDDNNLLGRIPWDKMTRDQTQRLVDGEDPEKVIPGFKLN